jgi:N-acetylglucosamine-6-phosphate deacetylase
VIEIVGATSDVRVDPAARRFEAPDFTLVPGFIDPHVHGCAGVDVMDARPDALHTVGGALARHGTTSFLPTTVSSPPDVLSAVIERLGLAISEPAAGAQPLGIHLEGPFISREKRGTHRADNVQLPNPALLSEWIRRSQGKLKLLTMAPELDGADAIAAAARSSGVVIAMGHSDATYAQACAAIDDGTRYAVHTFNAMRPFTHRESGIVGAVLADDRVYAEIIADGIHVSPEVIRIFSRVKPPDRVLLVTDAISATGMPDGRYVLGKGSIEMIQGVCRDSEGRLAGSTLTQDVALRNFIKWTGARLEPRFYRAGCLCGSNAAGRRSPRAGDICRRKVGL